MPIGYFLQHRVSIVRRQAVLDGFGQPTFNELGQPIVAETTVAESVPASIQPKTGQRAEREVENVSQGGTALGDTSIYLLPQDLTTADAIHHDPDFCPISVDLPDVRYEIIGVPLAAGVGHHIEVRAKMIESPSSTMAVASGEGSS